MRSQEQLNSPEFNDDLLVLHEHLKHHEIPHTYLRHRGASDGVKQLLGYYPTGEHHIVVMGRVSIIRGMASFGLYELYSIGGDRSFPDPERFATVSEVYDALANALSW